MHTHENVAGTSPKDMLQRRVTSCELTDRMVHMKGAIFPTRSTNFACGILIYSLKPDVSSTANSLKIMLYAHRSSRLNNHWRHQILRSSITGGLTSIIIIIKITSSFLFRCQSFQSKAASRAPGTMAAILFFPVHERKEFVVSDWLNF